MKREKRVVQWPRYVWATANGTPSFRDVFTRALASFRVRHSGFSQNTAMPAFIAFIAGS